MLPVAAACPLWHSHRSRRLPNREERPRGGVGGIGSYARKRHRRQGAMLVPCSGSLRGFRELNLAWCRGGDVGGAFFGLALLSVSSARRGALRACSAGVLGGSRIARAAGSSPATSKTCLVVCCSGAAGAATLGRLGVAAPGQVQKLAALALGAEGNAGRFGGLCWVH